MKKKLFVSLMGLAMVGIVATSCKKESTTYADVESILDTNCAVSGCHDGSNGGYDFSTYAGLKTVLDNGKFTSRVLTIGDMPPAGLSTTDKDKITAWKDNGFAEN